MTLAGTLGTGPVGGQDVPREISALELSDSSDGPVLSIRADRKLDWSGEFDAAGTLVLRFPDSVPGPAVGSIGRDSGLVAAIEVGFAVPAGRPTTTISVLGRRPFRYEARPTADGLELALLPAASATGEAGSTASAAAASAAGDAAALKRRLAAEAESNRSLAAELELVRGELRAQKDVAARLEADRLGLLSETEEARAQVSELRRELESLRTADSRQETAAAAADLSRLRQELTAVTAREQAERERAGALEERIARLESELESAVGGAGDSRHRVAELETAVAAATAESKAARGLLAAAPGLLGADEFVVAAGVTPCLNVRGSPSREGRVVECLPPGSPFAVVNLAEGWLRARLADGREGWVAADFVESRAQHDRSRERRAREELAATNDRLGAERQADAARLVELEERLRAADESLSRARREQNDLIGRLRAAEERAEAAASDLAAERRVGAELRARLVSAEERAAAAEAGGRERLAVALEALGAAKVRVAASVSPCLRLRPQPRAEGAALDCLEGGTEARVVGFEPGWLELVLSDERRGWAAVEYLETDSSAAAGAAEARAGGLVAELRDLQARVAAAEGARAADATELETVRAELAARDAELVEARANATRAQDGLATATERMDRAETAAQEGAAGRRELELRLIEVQSAYDELVAAQGRLTAELAAAEERSAGLEEERRALTTRVEELGRERDMLAAERAQSDAGRVDTERRVEEAEARAAELTARYTVATKDLEEVRDRNATLERESEGLVGQVESLMRERDELARVAAEPSVAEGALLEARERISTLERESERLAGQVESLTRERDELARAAAPPRVDDTGLREARARIAALERNRAELAQRLAAVEAERDDLRARSATVGDAAAGEEDPDVVAAASSEPIESGALLPSEPIAAEALSVEMMPAAIEPELPAESDLVALVEAWATAWSAQRVDDYLFFYARDFQPAGGGSRSDWEELRRRRLTAPSVIAVDLADLTIEIDGPNRARAVFEQSYRSDTYQDRVRKALELVREEGLWKILAEITL